MERCDGNERLSINKRDTTPEGWLFLKTLEGCFDGESESESSSVSLIVYNAMICDHRSVHWHM